MEKDPRIQEGQRVDFWLKSGWVGARGLNFSLRRSSIGVDFYRASSSTPSRSRTRVLRIGVDYPPHHVDERSTLGWC